MKTRIIKLLIGLTVVILVISISYVAYKFFTRPSLEEIINNSDYAENTDPLTWEKSSGPEYKVCYCCCPGIKPVKECLYHSEGDDIEEIQKSASDANCSNFGCAWPTLYKYCDKKIQQ